MSDLNLAIITETDKQQISFGACVGGMAVTGMAVGRFVGLQGVLAGGIAGAAFGLLTCKRLAPAVKQKLFSSRERLSDSELTHAFHVMRERQLGRTKSELIPLLAQIRSEIASNPAKYQKC